MPPTVPSGRPSIYPFWLNSRLMECSTVPGLTLGSPTAMALTRCAAVKYPSNSSGDVLRTSRCCRTRIPRRRWGAVLHINVNGQQIADGVLIFRRFRRWTTKRPGVVVAFPGTINRQGEPARRSPHTQPPWASEASLEAASPARSASAGPAPTFQHVAQQVVVVGSFQNHRTVRRQGRALVVAGHAVLVTSTRYFSVSAGDGVAEAWWAGVDIWRNGG